MSETARKPLRKRRWFRLLVVAAVLLLALGAFIHLACDIIIVPPYVRGKQAPVPFVEGQAEGAKLEILDGIPILTLRGSNKQMGRQAGLLLKDQIQALIRDYLNFLFRDPAKRRKAMEKARALEKHMPPECREELLGMSETAGVPYEDLLLANTFMDDYPAFLCSTLTVRGGATAHGRPLMGRNLDFLSLGVLKHYSMLIIYHPEKGNSFASVSWPGAVGVASGMNSHGLAAAMLLSFNGDVTGDGAPSTLTFRMLLQRCKTVEEGIRFLQEKENRIASAFNLSLADAEGEMCVAELAGNHFEIRRPEDDVLICTNDFIAGRYSDMPLDGRFRRMQEIVSRERGKFDVEKIESTMAEVYLPLINIQCMVFAPEDGELYLSIGGIPAAKGRFRKIDLSERFAEATD